MEVYSIAQSILGVDFITPEEIMKACPSISYSDVTIAVLRHTVPCKEVMKWCKENEYVVMPAPPQESSIMKMIFALSTSVYKLLIEPVPKGTSFQCWYADEKFACEDKTSLSWLLIKKTHVANSNVKTWGEQERLLGKFETVPNVAEMCWFITTYFEVRGIRLFENIGVRTSSLDSTGYRVAIGFFKKYLRICHHWGDERVDGFGLSSIRK